MKRWTQIRSRLRDHPLHIIAVTVLEIEQEWDGFTAEDQAELIVRRLSDAGYEIVGTRDKPDPTR